MPWIHNNKNWPTFTWNSDALALKLADIRYRQGLLLGRMKSVGFDLRQESRLATLTTDIVKSSAIEGEDLNPDEVRSSIARKLGLDIGGYIPPNRHVEGIVEMMLDATANHEEALTAERLFGWHAALFPTGWNAIHKIRVGAWREGSMQVVSGRIGREKVHFEAPAPDRLENEMAAFLNWFGKPPITDPLLKAGIAHLWFVTIHPFEDGNGRIARAITDMALARADGTADRFYSMSGQIERERKSYYNILETQQRSTPDITTWLDWFLSCLGRAFDNAETTLEAVLHKTVLWKIANQASVNERQRLILNRMLDDFKGYMNTSKYAKIAKCSHGTAFRDISTFLARGLFIQNPGSGRSTSYRLPTPEEIKIKFSQDEI